MQTCCYLRYLVEQPVVQLQHMPLPYAALQTHA